MKLLKFWSFFLVSQAQKVIWGQKCAKVPNLKDFELAKYAGVWYEQVRYPNTFQKKGSICTSATYGALTSISVTVNNTEYDPHGDSYHRQSAIGKAIQVNPENFPNEFKVSFSHPRNSERAEKANYNVMATDYKNYSIVMSCQDFPGFKVEFGWILARDRLFREYDAYKKVKELADTFKFDFKDAITTNQDPSVCPKIF